MIVPTGQQHTLAPVSAGNGGSITALAISPSEDLLGLLTADRRLMTYNLGSVDAINVGPPCCTSPIGTACYSTRAATAMPVLAQGTASK